MKENGFLHNLRAINLSKATAKDFLAKELTEVIKKTHCRSPKPMFSIYFVFNSDKKKYKKFKKSVREDILLTS